MQKKKRRGPGNPYSTYPTLGDLYTCGGAAAWPGYCQASARLWSLWPATATELPILLFKNTQIDITIIPVLGNPVRGLRTCYSLIKWCCSDFRHWAFARTRGSGLQARADAVKRPTNHHSPRLRVPARSRRLPSNQLKEQLINCGATSAKQRVGLLSVALRYIGLRA